MPEPAVLLSGLFDAAIMSAQAKHVITQHLPAAPRGRTIVIGAGKASAAMAQALEQAWDGPLSGCVVTRYGYAVKCQHIRILEAAHPVPDKAGHQAAQHILEQVQSLTADDLVIALISGGGSSLLPLPAAGVTLENKQAINRDLLRSGATISEMNIVRRHLSAIKGGRLAAACWPARVANLLISDVPGDNPADIASGPTVGDASTCQDALTILTRYKISVPADVQRLLNDGTTETIKPDDPRLAHVSTTLIATPQIALMAAADRARQAGITPIILGDSIEGEAREVATVMAAIARQVKHHGQPARTPCVLLSGGETTVTMSGNGRGGRNVEFLLSLALALQGEAGIYAVAGDTDGVDGQEDIAGALIDPDTLERAWGLGLSPREYLDNNDAHTFFERLGNNLITGPTLTNVNDFRAILIQ